MKQGGIVAAISGSGLSATTVKATRDSYYLGDGYFVEMKIEYKGGEEYAESIGCGGLKYLTGESMVTLLNYSTWQKDQSNILLGHRGRLRDPSALEKGIKMRLLTAEETFQGYSEKAIELQELHTPEMPKFQLENGEMYVKYGDSVRHLNIGQKEKLALEKKRFEVIHRTADKKEVKISHPEEDKPINRERYTEKETIKISLAPTLTVKAHGKKAFYGGENKTIVPSDSDHTLANHISGKSSASQQSDEMIVVSTNGESK